MDKEKKIKENQKCVRCNVYQDKSWAERTEERQDIDGWIEIERGNEKLLRLKLAVGRWIFQPNIASTS